MCRVEPECDFCTGRAGGKHFPFFPLRYDGRMVLLKLSIPSMDFNDEDEEFSPLRAVGLATAVVGVVTLGLFVGRELRFRYKFQRRTPSDFFANAGRDSLSGAEYGMGV